MTREDLIQEKINQILDWASEHPEFDVEYVERLNEAFENRGTLSPHQEEALDNIIIEKWGIND